MDTVGGPDARHAYTVAGTLRVESGNVPRTLNPILGTQTVESSLARLTTDILVSVDAHGTFVPRLAREVPTLENGGISADGRTITYHLRPGIVWHDGAPFTSRDVKFTFDAIMNPNNDVISRHGYDEVARVDTPDPLTVVFHLRERFAPFIGTVFGESDSPYGVLPAHLLARYKSLNDVPYNSAPIGTGPFKFARWLRGDRIEFVRNDRYFLGKPKLERIVWRLVPDENTELELLRTHEVDWAFEITVNAYRSLKTIPDIGVVLQPSNGYQAVMFNAGRGATANVHVRRAIVMALDKQRLTDTLTYGAGLVATGDLPSFMWAFDPALRNLGYSPARAQRELALAGYGPAKRLALDIVYEESSATSRALLVQIQAGLKPIGIDLAARSQLSSIFYGGYGAGGTLARGKYDIAITGWVAGIDPDDSSQFTCANRPPAGFNWSAYCSHAMDAAQLTALDSYAVAQRKPAYATIQRLLVTDAPMDFFWWPRTIQGISPDLHDFDPNPVVETWDAYTWSI